MSHTVLIVEDEAEIRRLYGRPLQEAGYNILEAVNGAQAMSLIQEAMPSVILLDMLMPAMSGELFLKRLREMPNRPETHVIVLTAYPGFRETALSLGADEFLVKPILVKDLLERVQSQAPSA
jgi:CheY-like chemotaxis protein